MARSGVVGQVHGGAGSAMLADRRQDVVRINREHERAGAATWSATRVLVVRFRPRHAGNEADAGLELPPPERDVLAGPFAVA